MVKRRKRKRRRRRRSEIMLMMRKQGNRDGHWIRRSTKIMSYFVSEAVDTIVKKTPEVPFMV